MLELNAPETNKPSIGAPPHRRLVLRLVTLTPGFFLGGLCGASAALAPVAYAPAVNYQLKGHAYKVAIGDLNGDGHPDLAVADGHNVSVLFGRGDGSFPPAIYHGVQGEAAAVAIGDLNGDGHPDLAVADAKGISVLFGRGDGSFQPAINYRVQGEAQAVAIGDLNGDGHPDLATVNLVGNVSVLLGRGDGSFKSADYYRVRTALPLGGLTLSLAIGDLNHDGHPDLVVGGLAPAALVLLGRGDGTLRHAISSASHSVYRSSAGVAIGDLNGDGHPDLAVTGLAPGPNRLRRGDVSVLFGRGDGTSRRAVNYRIHGTGYSVAIGDLNGDGHVDLAVTTSAPDGVSVLLGRGNGRFQRPINYRIHGFSGSVAIGDLNGDGQPDLATANFFAGDVSVLLSRRP
jgi:hypothetical protein